MASLATTYAPCFTGLHVCGISRDGSEFCTVENLPMRNVDHARRAFRLAREELAAAQDEADLVVDLCDRGDINEDFWIRRQQLVRLEEIARECGA